tara:strand:+ start:917 stop:1519 length:603 start_codon:yes stop_codon:yes gene_type:complete
MNTFKLETPCIIEKLKVHLKIKNKLINLINNAKADYLNQQQGYYSDLIHRLDWNNSHDFNREWVKFLKPYLSKQLKKFANLLGYQDIKFANLWFQQYNQNGKHGWHIHSENYTGVYYVKFSANAAKTELINPFSQNEKIVIDAKEGDLVIFPSYVIHRAPTQKQSFKKIIVSFNFNLHLINENLFPKLNDLKGISTNEYI